MANHDLIPTKEACKQLGITPHTFYSYRRRYPEHLKTVVIARRSYVRKQTLTTFIAHLEEEQAAQRRAQA